MKHDLDKLTILTYALEGLMTYRGIYSGQFDDEEAEQIDANVKELERRINLVNKATMPDLRWNIVWSPEGRVIATVTAKTADAAKRLTPKPYKAYMGEVYVSQVE